MRFKTRLGYFYPAIISKEIEHCIANSAFTLKQRRQIYSKQTVRLTNAVGLCFSAALLILCHDDCEINFYI